MFLVSRPLYSVLENPGTSLHYPPGNFLTLFFLLDPPFSEFHVVSWKEFHQKWSFWDLECNVYIVHIWFVSIAEYRILGWKSFLRVSKALLYFRVLVKKSDAILPWFLVWGLLVFPPWIFFFSATIFLFYKLFLIL